jgi:hypothetical protein
MRPAKSAEHFHGLSSDLLEGLHDEQIAAEPRLWPVDLL